MGLAAVAVVGSIEVASEGDPSGGVVAVAAGATATGRRGMAAHRVPGDCCNEVLQPAAPGEPSASRGEVGGVTNVAGNGAVRSGGD